VEPRQRRIKDKSSGVNDFCDLVSGGVPETKCVSGAKTALALCPDYVKQKSFPQSQTTQVYDIGSSYTEIDEFFGVGVVSTLCISVGELHHSYF